MFEGWYEEVALTQDFKYKTIILIGEETIDFGSIIKNLCSRIIKENEFLNVIKANTLVDWTVKKGNYYGYAKKSLLDIIELKRVPIIPLPSKAVPSLLNSAFFPLVIYLELEPLEKTLDKTISWGLQENEFINKHETQGSNYSINPNRFESVRHLTDYYIKFTEIE
ncbi:hypothetical protein HZS_6882, partial [Henneguya salminicola]